MKNGPSKASAVNNPVNFLEPKLKFYSKSSKSLSGRSRSVLDFWQWAYSDLIQNITRGIVAEFLVSWAVGRDDVPRQPWESCDLVLSNGLKVEVKSTAYVQAWTYTKKITPQFIIRPRRPYSLDKGLSKQAKFNADVYVLCYHKENNRNLADPMDVDQWEFWVLSQQEVRQVLMGRQGITVKRLRQHRQPIEFGRLEQSILKIKAD